MHRFAVQAEIRVWADSPEDALHEARKVAQETSTSPEVSIVTSLTADVEDITEE